MNNKYLTNKGFAVYTRFRFLNNTNDKDKNVMDFATQPTEWGNYVLIPSRRGYSGMPNGTAYFVESARVTLGGGINLEKLDRDDITSSEKSGHITIN